MALFLPGPVTKQDLLMDGIRCARNRRLGKIRRRRIQWLKENVGALIFIIDLFAFTWFVTAR